MISGLNSCGLVDTIYFIERLALVGESAFGLLAPILVAVCSYFREKIGD